MDCSMPGFPVHHQLLEPAQTHVSCQWCHPTTTVIPISSCPQSFPASGSFPVSQFLASDGQSVGVSVSASVIQMNIQDWFPLGLTGLISLLSKELSRVFSNKKSSKYQFFGAQYSLCISHPYMTTGKTIALTIQTFLAKVMSLQFLIIFIGSVSLENPNTGRKQDICKW